MTESAVSASAGNSALDRIASLQTGTGIMSTVVANTEDEKRSVLAALMNAVPLQDHIGEVLELVNIIVQAVTVEDAATGEMRNVARTVLLTADGKAYHTTSESVVNSLRDTFAVLGQPSEWKNPLRIVVSQEKGNSAARKFFKISLA